MCSETIGKGNIARMGLLGLVFEGGTWPWDLGSELSWNSIHAVKMDPELVAESSAA
jgi:hypothetical protein